MPNKILYLKPTNKGFQYGNRFTISVENTSFPFQFCGIKDGLLWKAEIIDYDKAHQQLKLKILDYDSKDENAFQKQNPKTQLNWIDSEKFLWSEFEKCLYFYQKINLEQYLIDNVPQYDSREDWPSLLQKKQENNASITIVAPVEVSHPIVKKDPEFIEQVFSFPIRKIVFCNGYGEFKITKNFCRVLSVTEILNISNPDIKEEFQAIIPYIRRAIKSDTISVKLKLEKQYFGGVKPVSLESEDFSKINSGLIESARLDQFNERLLKFTPAENGKRFYSSSELQNSMNLSGEPLEEDKILEQLLKDQPGVHWKELSWLSGIQSLHANARLKFVPKPDISFLFYVEKKDKCFFILETYKQDRATYIWIFDKIKMNPESEKQWMKEKYDDTETEVLKIEKAGRHQYREMKPLNFAFVDHGNDDAGFPIWKSSMEAILKGES